MRPRDPIAALPTHDVVNVPPHIGDQDLWADDRALRDWARLQGAGGHEGHLAAVGRLAGRDETFDLADQANRYGPELRAFDRHGMRIDTIAFHPAYHDLMERAVANGLHNFAWRHEDSGGHASQSVLTYMFSQPEGGVMCPMAMAYSAAPSLRTTPAVEAAWMPLILSTRYDRRDIPAAEKTGALIGMFMTEKQGGSDVRSNSTVAMPLSAATGIGADYALTGHKFFCSAPMCDAFLVLAKTAETAISCFLVPRWRPDGARNALFIQRLKDKLGNRSNATCEIEFQDAYGVMVGEEGRGIRTIMEMVNGNRLYCAMSSAGIMRQALVQALHHAAHRSAFQKRLIQQPLMRNVLADMAVETEAALALGLRVARSVDEAGRDPAAAKFARIGTALAKYWNTKRCPALVVEALECHGGPGYIEDGIMPRLYREAPLNAIWEGSGNVIGLDVLRAMQRDPETVAVFLAEAETARGDDPRLDRAMDELRDELDDHDGLEGRMRIIVGAMARVLQGALLTRHAPAAVAEAFCATRLAPRFCGTFGALPARCDLDGILDRAMPDGAPA